MIIYLLQITLPRRLVYKNKQSIHIQTTFTLLNLFHLYATYINYFKSTVIIRQTRIIQNISPSFLTLH